MDDKDRDKHTGPGEAVEETMPELEDLPGDARERDERREPRDRPEAADS